MAIYHLHAKLLSRSHGRNAVESAAYRHACTLFEETLQVQFDYSRKSHVLHNEMSLPSLSFPWLSTLANLAKTDTLAATQYLWNLVEKNEKRVDAQVAREIEFSLPMELSLSQNIQLAREFIEDQCVSIGMIADWSVHWDEGNPHVHVMLTTRALTPEGFGQKVRAWNAKSQLSTWRAQWAQYANFHLRMHGHETRLDHRSYIEQGIDLVPTFHLGRASIERAQQGLDSERLFESQAAALENLTRIAHQPENLFRKITAQQDIFSAKEVQQAFQTYTKPFTISSSTLNTPVLASQDIHTLLSTLEYHESVFSDKNLQRALNQANLPSELIPHAIHQIKTSPLLMALGAGEDGRDRYTTRRLFLLENQLQTWADTLWQRKHINIKPYSRDKALSHYEIKKGKRLTQEQREAIHQITGTKALSCLVGRAGTGKSFSLGAARAVWENEGCTVLGVALSGIAACGLEKEAGIPSRTLESFRYAMSQGKLDLTSRHILVMDEAGMTDIQSMAHVMSAVTRARAKLVLVGDPNQLQPVGPGAIFRALLERVGFVSLNTVYRQQVAWQVEATQLLAKGEVAQALRLYQAQGYLRFEKTAQDAMYALVGDWLTDSQTSPSLSSLLVLAHRNADVDALNTLIREARILRSDITAGFDVQTASGIQQVSVGDRLLFLKNDRQRGFHNGRFATVTTIMCHEDKQVAQLTVQLDGNEETITFSPTDYAHFTHGYAATVHKSQGVTVDKSYIFADGKGWDRNLTYVAGTRHRQACRFYAAQSTFHDEETLFKTLGRSALKDSVLDFPYHFSQRRGLEPAPVLTQWTQSLRDKLKITLGKINARYQQIFHPAEWAQWQTRELVLAQKAHQDRMRREEARLVATYVDTQREIGQHYAHLQKTQKETSHVAVRPDIQALLAKRNAIAFEILKDIARYEKAIAICQLSRPKLFSQAKMHRRQTHVKNDLQTVGTKVNLIQEHAMPPALTLTDILSTYLDMEIQQDQYLLLKMENLQRDPSLSQTHAKKAREQAAHLAQFALQYLSHPDVQSSIALLKQHPSLKGLSRHEYASIQARFLEKKASPEEVLRVVKQLHAKAHAYKQSLLLKQSEKQGQIQGE